MHWYQDWYQVGFLAQCVGKQNLRNSLEMQGVKLEAGVRIELTLGVLQTPALPLG